MGRRLAGTVHLINPETGERAVFLAGAEEGVNLPDWAVPLITNPRAWQSEEQAATAGSTSGTEAPAKSASKGDWVDYAVSRGMARDAAEAATKDDLIDTYGG